MQGSIADEPLRTTPEGQWVLAIRGEEEFVADDPVTVLGLIKPVEVGTWNWRVSYVDIEAARLKYQLCETGFEM